MLRQGGIIVIMTPSIEEIDQLERNNTNDLSEVLSLLMARWQAGARDEETAIRLLFLCWYSIVEPPFLTGLPDYSSFFAEIFEQAGGEDQATPLVLLAVALMAEMFPWAVGDEVEWTEQAERLESKAKMLLPDMGETNFSGFGAAGRYLCHVLKERKRYAAKFSE